MKLNFQHDGRDAAPRVRTPRSGIALVITLILLSVTAFMTITFLILAQRERGAVSVAANQTDARFAAETAVQRATAQLLAPVIGLNNANAYDLLVSTNFVSVAGYDNAYTGYNPTNVNYDHTSTGAALSAAQWQQNLFNLLYDPRPPVFITNKLTGTTDFRYYLDLNRNGRHDTNGYQPVVQSDGSFTNTTTHARVAQVFPWPAGIQMDSFVGDPEWIGVLERPDLPHSSTNRFISRYAYIALPAGKTLDLNYLHNYATRNNLTMNALANDGFMRNQGVGTWEINLAAFLADLNTNYWNYPGFPYKYTIDTATATVTAATGSSFDDALAMLRYRYNGNYNNLPGGPGNSNFQVDNVDEYSDGPLMIGTAPLATDNDATNLPWSGADNPFHFFSHQDLFDTNKTALGNASTASNLTSRLLAAGSQLGSYDRYTYYRLLAQLGTDTAPEQGKINVNYTNVDAYGNIIPNLETNYGSWTPAQFFTNVAPRLLTNYFGAPVNNDYGTNLVCYVTNNGNVGLQFNIQIYPTNYYTPAVHRLLQLAANLYDATTNNDFITTKGNVSQVEPRLPSVFRPQFGRITAANGVTYVLITNYVEETDPTKDVLKFGTLIRDVNNHNPVADTNSILNVLPDDNVYGIPLIIGARKGLPNFNEFAERNAITITRKMQFTRPNWPALTPITNNVMYTLSISNVLGIEAWNSSTNAYPRPLQMVAVADIYSFLITSNGPYTAQKEVVISSNQFVTGYVTNLTASSWSGYPSNNPVFSFQIPLYTNTAFLTNSTYRQLSQTVVPLTDFFESNLPGSLLLNVPRWWYCQNTRVRYILLDTSVTPNRIVDYASLSQAQNPVDVTYQLMGGQVRIPALGVRDTSPDADWATNINRSIFGPSVFTLSVGMIKQILVSKGDLPPSAGNWVPDATAVGGNDVQNAVTIFNDNINSSTNDPVLLTNVFYAPYDPTRTVYQHIDWQANDPLVHYMVGDLVNTNKNDPGFIENTVDSTLKNPPLDNLSNLNSRYQPWGGNPNKPGLANDYNFAVKDPLVFKSDDWQFPTNKLPGIGWIGRVHRGTPWQTVYLKSVGTDTNAVYTWTNWTGDNIITNYFTIPSDTNTINYVRANGGRLYVSSNAITQTNIDAMLTMPTNDWRLFDLLTATPNDNATRGQLSVNQTNLAAWSAVLGGVITLDSNANPVVIQPAGVDQGQGVSPDLTVQGIVNAINDVRTTNFNGTFNHLGEVLAVPQLSIGSPYLGATNGPANIMSNTNTVMSDAVVERIPQQILPLLRGKETRFVIYAYGQSLKPADRSILANGLCTNYQITGETAVRAVIRVEGPVQSPRAVVESFNYLSPSE